MENNEKHESNVFDSLKKNRKVIYVLMAFIVFIVIYNLKPWLIFSPSRISLQLGDQSFITGSPTNYVSFKANREIYYKISSSKAFNNTILSIQIFKLDKDNNEILHKVRQEIGIDPNSKIFSFVLRPDYFKESANYRIKMYFGKLSKKKIAAVYDFKIE